MTPFRCTPLLAALGLALAAPAYAQSLVDLYESAREYDAGYLSAKQQYQANLAKAAQAQAGVLPTVGLSVGVNRVNVDSDTPAFERSYGNRSATLSASQPLYRPANTAAAAQGDKQVVLAQAALSAAEQDLVVRVSQAYFDVLGAQDTLTFIRAQKTAVAEQLASAKRNFEVGTATITDTREAQAKFDLTLAQEIAAENDVRVKRLALEQLTGKTGAQPLPLRQPEQLPALAPADMQAWVAQSQEQNPSVVQAKLAVDVARLESSKAQAGARPTLDLTGTYGITQNSGSTSTSIDYRTNVATVGLALNMPLFSGYAIQNRIKETLALEDKARTDLEGAQRAVAQATRSAFLGVQLGMSQVKALEAAQASSQSALEATQLGYQVGVRVNVDVLNAQTALYSTKAQLAQARYGVLVGTLRLRQAGGNLNASDLSTINQLLVH
jgi:outer membrane protein